MGWMSIVTGTDLLATYKPWSNKQEAMLKIKKHGGLVEIFDNSFRSIPPQHATDGDIAVIGTTSFLFVGRHIVSVGDEGLVFRNRCDATNAWSHKEAKCLRH